MLLAALELVKAIKHEGEVVIASVPYLEERIEELLLIRSCEKHGSVMRSWRSFIRLSKLLGRGGLCFQNLK